MSEDQKLKQNVLDELAWEPSVTAAHIGVTAKSGVVSLSGYVESFSEKHAAEVAASRVKGVKAVAEEIEVRLPVHIKRNDDEIAAAAISRLAWNASIPADSVKVKVEQGWITLKGQVDWHFEKDVVEQELRSLSGVIGVSNQLTIKPQVNAANISDKITHALHRSWFNNPDDVSVSAIGGQIKLSGTVQSWHDRKVAADTAWAAPGATAVENNILVT